MWEGVILMYLQSSPVDILRPHFFFSPGKNRHEPAVFYPLCSSEYLLGQCSTVLKAIGYRLFSYLDFFIRYTKRILNKRIRPNTIKNSLYFPFINNKTEMSNKKLAIINNNSIEGK